MVVLCEFCVCVCYVVVRFGLLLRRFGVVCLLLVTFGFLC